MIGIRYTCNLLQNGKSGIRKPDSDGYYVQCLGGLDCYNSRGEYYLYNEARPLFEESSHFMRRVKDGILKGECGHPKYLPGMTDTDYLRRIRTIEETNVSHVIREVWLEKGLFKNADGRPMVAIMGKVKPTGEKGKYLKEAFENPGENVCFSVRSFTEDRMVGFINTRAMVEILTFDWVAEPGINIATNFHTPGIESRYIETVYDKVFAKATVEAAIRKTSSLNIGNEDDSASLKRLLSYCGNYKQASVSKPIFSRW